ncbi:NfeD family protein [Campylobacter sp. US33a]|uniref:NfeD family protein n=1 Tax=Campylobacter sp. US33a TaxID=2498120 RepID=UPI001067E110|nr:nodulation protein NfeD [Campylobacter sp. US33a]TEY03111.1 nodulation protein NfeD [Campylobacter sp. US33a]
MLNAYLLLIIAFILAIIELSIGSFYVIFFALGFLIVGLLSLFVPLNLVWQILFIVFISLISLFVFKKFFKKTKKEESLKDNFLDESGEGVIQNGLIYYKGALWQSDQIKGLKNGDKVFVKGVKDNQIQITRD